MKKLLVILFISLILAGCSDEKKAQRLIKQYLKENLNDPSSYQPVSFGELEVYSTKYGQLINMKHKYRAKNAMGAIILEENTFEFDDAFTKVYRMK
ncbi:MAG: hypothetical protein LUF85_04280 [Bacteroides sp.]|nr:hypothetical protein [Bacteroides sp.]